MTHKFCPHCAAKNYFEIEPKFCCACGSPLNAAVAAVDNTHIGILPNGEPSANDNSDDYEYIRKPAKLEVDIDMPEQQWEKFGENISKEENPEFGREARQRIAATKSEWAKGEDVRHQMKEEMRLRRGTVGGED